MNSLLGGFQSLRHGQVAVLLRRPFRHQTSAGTKTGLIFLLLVSFKVGTAPCDCLSYSQAVTVTVESVHNEAFTSSTRLS